MWDNLHISMATQRVHRPSSSRWTEYYTYRRKLDAERMAGTMRNRGFQVRLTKSYKGYTLFVMKRI